MAHPAEALICPTCRRPPDAWPLDPELCCTNPACGRVYPRIRGEIPLIVPGPLEPYLAADSHLDLERALAAQLAELDADDDAWESFFRTAMYAVSHYHQRPNAFTALCDELLPLIEAPVAHAVDFGCGVGGLAIEVARRLGARVVGLDSSPLSLRWAAMAARGEPFELPVRLAARSFAMAHVTAPSPAPGRVDWVCAEVAHPPLSAEAVDLALVVNLLDSVPDPWVVLGQASASVREGGHLILAQPDAWTAQIAPASQWIAEDEAGWTEALARFGLRTVRVMDGLEWTLERTKRMRFGYTLHARLAVREPWPE